LKKGGPAKVPTFPNSAVPRAKITVTSVQQLLFMTPSSVRPPPFPCGVQARSVRIGTAAAVLASAVMRIWWNFIVGFWFNEGLDSTRRNDFERGYEVKLIEKRDQSRDQEKIEVLC
jgi:hypothetical protein